MRLHRCLAVAALVPLLLMGVPMAYAAPDAEGVTVALLPSQRVEPGNTFDLYLEVTEAGSEFNGFQAVIGYDPAALTFVPGSNQEGSYMTGACGNTFHVFHAGASTDTIVDVLLCSGVSLPGPGRLYQLSFQASMTPQVTQVRFVTGPKYPKVYKAGVYVEPVNFSDVWIGVGMDVGVGPPAPPQRLGLRAAPNPSSGALTFTVESNRAGPAIVPIPVPDGLCRP